MFTGIVEAMGEVLAATPADPGRAGGVRLDVVVTPWPRPVEPGESICVSGCCLTALATGDPARVVFDVVPETLAKTTLGAWRTGQRVNLERSATPTTLLGGHLVQGHVDGVGRVLGVERAGEHRLRIGVAPGLMEAVAPKGSVAIDGVSLTIAGLDPVAGWFEVALIPTTLAKTTLGELRPGGACNVECDAIAKTVVHWLRHFSGR